MNNKTLAQELRELLDLLRDPAMARTFAELCNAPTDENGDPVFPFEIDMDDPDAPWNDQDTESED